MSIESIEVATCTHDVLSPRSHVAKFLGVGSYGRESRDEVYSSLFIVEEYIGSKSLMDMILTMNRNGETFTSPKVKDATQI